MSKKGRSPTMRHVSRTHRVALDWLFDRTNLDSKIQIKCVDTKNQLADMLTKGSFTRDEWNRKQSAMSKRGQEGTFREGSAMAKPRRCEFDDGEAETNEFGVAHKAEQGGVFIWHMETDPRHEPKSSRVRVFSSEATGRHSKCKHLKT